MIYSSTGDPVPASGQLELVEGLVLDRVSGLVGDDAADILVLF